MKKTLFFLLLSVVAVFSYAQPACNPKGDFSFSRNPCTPFEISFSTNAGSFNNIRWFFGDASTSTGIINPAHTYSGPGNYTVTLITDYTNCADTVVKTFTLDIQQANQLIQTNDTLICFGSSKQLHSAAGLSYCWSPATYLNNASSPNPVTTATQDITYYLTALSTGQNLIVNGDFSNGNTGFTSEYTYNPSSGFDPGMYTVTNNLVAWHPSMPPCGDHSSGTGYMMAVNGAQTPNVKVWAQTVNVTPNTNYVFSTWLQHVTSSNPARLQFSINNNVIGPVFIANNNTCIWDQFYATWNSGNNTVADISIVNQNQVYTGNDFTLDDIFFAPVSMLRDSVKITVEKPVVNASGDVNVCTGRSVQLNCTGAVNYSWTPSGTLSNPSISNPIASPAVTTKYFVTGSTVNNCSAMDSVLVSVLPLPTVTIIPDTIVCAGKSIRLFAGGGVSYSWTPAGTLNNPLIPDPLATPLSDTRYYVRVVSTDGCENTDSTDVRIRQPGPYTISPSETVCQKETTRLMAAGGHLYVWSPATGLSDPLIRNPSASPASTTQYTVQITDTVCHFSTNLSTTVTIIPLPSVTAVKSGDLDCSNSSSQLNAGGAISYSWFPSTGLSDINSPSPVATPADTTKYTVTGTDANGCKDTAAVTVNVIQDGKGVYHMPTAFTPNGDGKNDCYGLKFWGVVRELDFSIYNRWGERIFHTRNPADCWNGYYKGVLQESAVYVFVIKAKTNCGDAYKKGTFTLIR